MEYNIPSNLYCANCDYNVRGLRATGLCPECGTPIADALARAPTAGVPYRQAMLTHILRELLAPLAEKSGYKVDALMLVVDAVRHHSERMQHEGAPQAADGAVGAKQFCESFYEFVALSFTDEQDARETLAEWGIARWEDLQAIVQALCEAKMTRINGAFLAEQFEGLFSLEDVYVISLGRRRR